MKRKVMKTVRRKILNIQEQEDTKKPGLNQVQRTGQFIIVKSYCSTRTILIFILVFISYPFL